MIEAIVGAVTGVIASMGLGGGFVLMIWLTVFAGVDQRTAQGINLLFFLPIALLSLVFHLRAGLVNKQLVRKYLIGGVTGAVLGTVAAGIVPVALLRTMFSLFLLGFGVKELLTPKETSQQAAPPDSD